MKNLRLTKRSKEVAVYKDGVLKAVYASMTEAAEREGVRVQNVWKVCATDYKSTLNGLEFRYV